MAVLLISSELDEVVGLAHRILVIREGQRRRRVRAWSASREEAVLRAALAA